MRLKIRSNRRIPEGIPSVARGTKPSHGQSNDIGEVESFKLGVVGDVEKYGVLFNALSWHCCAVPSGSLQS